jgi:hypothetical protein
VDMGRPAAAMRAAKNGHLAKTADWATFVAIIV